MEIYGKDFIFGNFRLSDYGFMIGSFSYGDSEDDLGITPTVIEEFIGHNPVPIYLGQKYEKKLELLITLIKNPCIFSDDMAFTEKELRSVLRAITGIRGYQWLKVINQEIDDDLWYKARVSDVSYKRIGGQVIGVTLTMICNSAFAWSKMNEISIQANTGQSFYIFNNTDDLHNYVLPFVEITTSGNKDISITNKSDHNWTSVIQNVKSNEKITVDSRRDIIVSSNANHNYLLNDFNLHWFRLIPGKNEYVSNTDIAITFKYRVPRKVGFTE